MHLSQMAFIKMAFTCVHVKSKSKYEYRLHLNDYKREQVDEKQESLCSYKIGFCYFSVEHFRYYKVGENYAK